MGVPGALTLPKDNNDGDQQDGGAFIWNVLALNAALVEHRTLKMQTEVCLRVTTSCRPLFAMVGECHQRRSAAV